LRRASGSVRRRPATARGSFEDRRGECPSGVDADDVVGSPTHQEGALKPLGVKARHVAEGRDRGADAHPLGKVDEQVSGPSVDLLVALLLDHAPIAALFDGAHALLRS